MGSLFMMISCPEKVIFILKHSTLQLMLYLDRACLVELCIQKINETGTIVTNVVCDNPRVNINMMTALGACLQGTDPDPTLTPMNVAGKQACIIL